MYTDNLKEILSPATPSATLLRLPIIAANRMLAELASNQEAQGQYIASGAQTRWMLTDGAPIHSAQASGKYITNGARTRYYENVFGQ